MTIHSFFQLPFGPFIPSEDNNNEKSTGFRQNIHKFNKEKINIIKCLDLLVIDEISMVRAVLLLNPIKEELGHDFSYGELKLVQAYLSFLKK